MLLTELLNKYEAKKLRNGSDNTLRLYKHTLSSFAQFLGRPPAVSDLTDETIETFMFRTVKLGGSPASANKHRSQITALWRFAYHRKLTEKWPDVKPMKEPEQVVLAWMPDEVDMLMAACRRVQGSICGATAALWWRTLLSVLLETGERIGAIMQLEKTSLTEQWIIVPAKFRKGKTRDRIYKLEPETMELVRKLADETDSPLIFPWPYRPNYLWNRYRKLIDDAGLPIGRKRAFHALRKTCASAVQRAGGDATAALDHASPKTTKRYLDQRIVGGESPSSLLKRFLADPALRTRTRTPPDAEERRA